MLTSMVIMAVYSSTKTGKKKSFFPPIIFFKSGEVYVLCVLVLEHFAMFTS